jgi:putative SOS response-associated peptidase YedK
LVGARLLIGHTAERMCNDFANRVGYREIVAAFSHLKLPVVSPGPERAPNLEPRDDIRPTDPAPIIRAAEGGVDLAEMKWGFPPSRPKAPPVINFRSEGRRFTTGRCLAPASAFYEFTGSRYPKTKWRFTLEGEPWFCMAALWRVCDTPNGPEPRFTLLTTAPGPDIVPYHNRQVAVLERSDWPAWIGGEAAPEGLLRPLPAGRLHVEQVLPGDDTTQNRLI